MSVRDMQSQKRGPDARLHHVEVLLHQEMRQINLEEKHVALNDRRGFRGIFRDLREEAAASPVGFAFIAMFLAMTPAPFVAAFFKVVVGETTMRQNFGLLLFSVLLCFPMGILFWLFLVDTSAFSPAERTELVVQRVAAWYGYDVPCALQQVEDAWVVVQQRSRVLTVPFGVGFAVLLNVVATPEFQAGLLEGDVGVLYHENPFGTVLLLLLPLAAIVYAVRFGFSVYWLRTLQAALRLKFSRLPS